MPAPVEKGSSKAPPADARAANKRGMARLAAVQALYQMDLTGARLMDVVAEYENFRLGREVDQDESDAVYRDADAQWFRAILSGVIAAQKEIDPLIHSNLPADWPLARIETLLRSILRAGVWEIKERPDVPARVAITEYVDVAKAFYGEDEHKMVNAVLDRVARRLREAQMAPKPAASGAEPADEGAQSQQAGETG